MRLVGHAGHRQRGGWDRAVTASALMSTPSRGYAAPKGQPLPQPQPEKGTGVSRELFEQQGAGHWQLLPPFPQLREAWTPPVGRQRPGLGPAGSHVMR